MSPDSAPFIVGIGASAGGIEAFEAFFRAMPATDGIAFVIVVHLDPKRESLLPEILGRWTSMPVVPAADGLKVEGGHVYVITPDTNLTIKRGILRIADRAKTRGFPNAVDVFLSALAVDQGSRAIGIILSGTGNDGTLGIKAIKECGGLTLAQGTDSTAPRYLDMPGHAIASGLVDFILPVHQIPERLIAYIRAFDGMGDAAGDGDGMAEGEDAPAVPSHLRKSIFALLRNHAGHDFSGYKEKTFQRRVHRRMQVLQIANDTAYVERLRQDPDEVQVLFRDLLIGVTNFFRDSEAFRALQTKVIPEIFKKRGADDIVRVWVPGCATGEEAYSIAILLREYMDGLPAQPKVQVFATDIDERALAIARIGRYPATLLEEIGEERLRRFFTDDGVSHTVCKAVRDMCIFSAHSLIRDPPFSRIDLISCRNLLIYFGAELQSRVIPIFHYALRSNGFLMLGIAENVTQQSHLFTPLDKKHRIFRAREQSGALAEFPLFGHLCQPARAPFTLPAVKGQGGFDLTRSAAARVMERFAPAHVVVNREGDVLHYSARTGKYLEPAPGAPSRHLLSLARRGLRLDLRAAMQEALETLRPVTRDSVMVEVEGGVQVISLTVEPLSPPDAEPLSLVVFTDIGPVRESADAAVPGGDPRLRDASLEHCERELRETRERLQSTIEEYETSLEELKSANEELLSVNEEMQSTNEELETSKEEIQSINEELHTVNIELSAKVEELGHVNNDLRNLLESTRIAVIFLDRDLIIRSFTPAVTDVFKVIPSDHGRPLTDIVSHLDYDDLTNDIRPVLETERPLERNIRRKDAAADYIMHILPYRDADNVIDGVLLTFVDVTSIVRAEEHQKSLVAELNHRVKNMLAVVQSIAAQTIRGSENLPDFTRAFLGRIHGLARTYGLLSRDFWADVALEELVGCELGPYRDADSGNLAFGGSPVFLKPKGALALGMVLHELGTNALKHGALSVPGGRVSLNWWIEEVEPVARLHLDWREEGGPPVTPSPISSYGLDLITNSLRYELDGTADVKFSPTGLKATLILPLSEDVGQPAIRKENVP